MDRRGEEHRFTPPGRKRPERGLDEADLESAGGQGSDLPEPRWAEHAEDPYGHYAPPTHAAPARSAERGPSQGKTYEGGFYTGESDGRQPTANRRGASRSPPPGG